MEWQKLHFTSSGGARYASIGKHVAKKLLSGKENTLPDGYGVPEDSCMPNDCILYKNKCEEMHNYPRCRVPWYKMMDDDECSSDESTKKGPPAKVLWYLPIIPRFKRLFANADDTKDLTWHADGRNCDGMLCHPADSS